MKKSEKKTAHDVWTLKGIPHLGPVNQERLNEVGIYSYHGMIVAGPIEIDELTGMGQDKCVEAVEHCRKYLIETGKLSKSVRSALDVYQERLEIEKVSSGCKLLDKQLFGGFETKSLIEAYGVYGSGKTQLAHTLAVMAQLPKANGGLNGSVLWIDTENTFRPERVVDIIKGRKLETIARVDDFLKGIKVTRVYSTDEQRLRIEELDKIISENRAAKGKKIRLVIIDSIIALPRAEYQGQGRLSRKQQHVNHMMLMLKRQSEIYDLVVFYTNQVYEDIQAWGDSTRPSGGHAIAHASSIRLYLKKGPKPDAKGQRGVIRMMDSPNHINFECPYNLSENEGFGDAPTDTK